MDLTKGEGAPAAAEGAEGLNALLRIGLLGPWEVLLHGRPLGPLRSRKGQWLLALLVLQKGRPIERDWLAGILWPDSSDSQGLYNLRRNLTDLRDVLGPEASRIQAPAPHTLAFDLAGASADVAAFDEAIACGDTPSLEAAVRLYRGPLLGECSEEWVVPERAAREQAYLTALERLAGDARERGDQEAAAGYLRLCVAVDPLRESAQRALMQALADSGEHAAATLVYREFRLLLHRELNSAPDSETTALYQELRAQARARTQARRSTSDHRTPPHPSAADVRVPSSLPRPVSSFVGRHDELAEIEATLTGVRLLTLTGPGGVGKTRLAIQVAEEVADQHPDGVYFVELAALADPALVVERVAQALGAREQPDRPLTEAMAEFLRPRRMLLVLDNCEHLLNACAGLADRLLGGCPDMRILATSRQSLGITGETVWRVPPLSLPDPHPPDTARQTPEMLIQYEAVRLFVERGSAATRAYALSEQNAAATVEVCRRLDGIPLAIELAAARLKALTVEQIAARLDDRFRLLTGGSRTSLPRQQALRATLDWSYDLLSEPERALFCRLSVFAGGFTLEAAEAVCADCGLRIADCGLGDNDERGPIPPRPSLLDNPQSAIRNPQSSRSAIRNAEVLDLLTQLVDKSLVHHESDGRYQLLEIVRQYSADRLRESGDGEEVRPRHREWFLSLAEQAERELQRPEQSLWLQRLEREHDNFRTAWDWTLEHGEGDMAVRLAGALWRFLYMRGHVKEGRLWLERALSMSTGSVTAARAKALQGAAVLWNEQDEHTAARAFAEESLALWRQLGDRHAVAQVLDQLGHIVNAVGDYQRAASLFEESLALHRELGDRSGTAAALNALGYMAFFYGDYERAAALCGESLSLRRELGDQWGIAYCLEFLGQMALDQGDSERAAPLLAECLAIRRQLGDRRGIAATLLNLARIARNQGDWAKALAHLEESLHLWEELGSAEGIIRCRRHLATTALHQGDHERATALYQEGLRMAQRIAEKRAMVECMEGLAVVAGAQGKPERAIRLLGAAEAAREAIGAPPSPYLRSWYEQVTATARAALGEVARAAAWAEGRQMVLEQAIGLALEA